MMKYHEVPVETSGNNQCGEAGNRQQDAGYFWDQYDEIREPVRMLISTEAKHPENSHADEGRDISKTESAQKKCPAILQVSLFSIGEEFLLLAVDGGHHCEIFSVPFEVVHHLFRHLQCGFHGQLASHILQHHVFVVFFFEPTRSAIEQNFRSGEQQAQHHRQAEQEAQHQSGSGASSFVFHIISLSVSYSEYLKRS